MYIVYVMKANAGNVYVVKSGESLVVPPYVKKSADGENWTKVQIEDENDEQYEISIELETNEEFSIYLGGGDSGWRHFENLGTPGSTNRVVAGSKTGEEVDDPHNFKASIAGEYHIYIKKTEAKVYITYEDEDPNPAPVAHGPEGANPVGYYIVGEGSLFSDDWSTAGGVQLFEDPGTENHACILTITFEEGDIFKITDGGSGWYGWHSDVGSGFEDDGTGNIRCKTTGTYNVYLNKDNVVYIAAV